MEAGPLIVFRLDRRSGVPAYRQLIDQVRHALRLGLLRPGDRLPTVRDVVKQIAINPNTVHRAYRDLEQQGLTEGRPGSGTFVTRSLSTVPDEQPVLLGQLKAWVRSARAAGLENIDAYRADALVALITGEGVLLAETRKKGGRIAPPGGADTTSPAAGRSDCRSHGHDATMHIRVDWRPSAEGTSRTARSVRFPGSVPFR